MKRLPFSAWHFVLAPLALLFALPLVWLLVSSVMSNAEINRFPPALIPHGIKLDGYRYVLGERVVPALVPQLVHRVGGGGDGQSRPRLARRVRVRADPVRRVEARARADAGDDGDPVPADDDPDVPGDEGTRADRHPRRADHPVAGDAVVGVLVPPVLRLAAARARGGGLDRRLRAAADPGLDRAAAGPAGLEYGRRPHLPGHLERPDLAADRDQHRHHLHPPARPDHLPGPAPHPVGRRDGRQRHHRATGPAGLPPRPEGLHPLTGLHRTQG